MEWYILRLDRLCRCRHYRKTFRGRLEKRSPKSRRGCCGSTEAKWRTNRTTWWPENGSHNATFFVSACYPRKNISPHKTHVCLDLTLYLLYKYLTFSWVSALVSKGMCQKRLDRWRTQGGFWGWDHQMFLGTPLDLTRKIQYFLNDDERGKTAIIPLTF